MGLIRNKKVFAALVTTFVLLSFVDLWGFYYVLVDPQFESNAIVRKLWNVLGKESIFIWKTLWISVICSITGFIYKRARIKGFIIIVVANLSLIYALINLWLTWHYLLEAGIL